MTKDREIELRQHSIVFRGTNCSSVGPLVEEIRKKGWGSFTVSGDHELRRAVWLEGTALGLTVEGYQPSPHDRELLEQMKKQRRSGEIFRLRASDVAADFSRRVVPKLQRDYEELRRQRRGAGITTTELDRAYGLNMPQGYRRDLDDRFFRVKSAVIRAMSAMEDFRSLGNRTVTVRQSFEDGVARFVLAEPEENVGLAHSLRHRR